MIQATELRIGNWVLGIVGQPERVVKLQAGAVYQWNNPIELTEEILLKCGFETYDDKTYKLDLEEGNRWTWLEYDKEYYPFVRLYCDDSFYMIDNAKASTLHQLQNLYYALTGEELEVNL